MSHQVHQRKIRGRRLEQGRERLYRPLRSQVLRSQQKGRREAASHGCGSCWRGSDAECVWSAMRAPRLREPPAMKTCTLCSYNMPDGQSTLRAIQTSRAIPFQSSKYTHAIARHTQHAGIRGIVVGSRPCSEQRTVTLPQHRGNTQPLSSSACSGHALQDCRISC